MLGAAPVRDRALQRLTSAKLRALELRDASKRAEAGLRHCEALKDNTLSQIVGRPELVAPPVNKTRNWWQRLGAVLQVLRDEERAETSFWRLRAG